jgi:hypothetical protein
MFCVETVTWALITFEILSEVKIIFSKIKLIPLNMNTEEKNMLAALVCCKFS